MRQRKFALQPLLEQRTHRENARRAELNHAHRARDAAVVRLTALDRHCDAARSALVLCASRSRIIEMQEYDAMLIDARALRLRYGAEVRAHEAAIATAAAALTIANRERRTLERLRERLEARRARRSDDD